MQCPKCSTEMDEVRKVDVVVDACNRCGGIWLDKGELDKIRESANQMRQEDTGSHRAHERDRDRYRDDELIGHAPDPRGHHKKKKKSPFDLLDIFE